MGDSWIPDFSALQSAIDEPDTVFAIPAFAASDFRKQDQDILFKIGMSLVPAFGLVISISFVSLNCHIWEETSRDVKF